MMLCEEFGVYGPIASVKIMKPYTAEEMRRSFTWGFVCFMNSTDAEEALAALNRTVLMGNTMNLEWGKTLPIPDRPFYGNSDYTAAFSKVASPRWHHSFITSLTRIMLHLYQ